MKIYILKQIEPDDGVSIFPFSTAKKAEETMKSLYENRKKWALENGINIKENRCRLEKEYAFLTYGHGNEYSWFIEEEALDREATSIIGECYGEPELSEEEAKGYAITDFDCTGMLEIQRIDAAGIFEDDEEAVEQAVKDGIKLIPVNELPIEFGRRYLGWVDTPENRERIEEYCKAHCKS